MHQKSVTQQIGELKLHAAIYGSGEPVLCLSGFGCSHYNFESLKKYLGEDYQCVLLDNRGMGKSQFAESDYELSDLARDAHEFMLKLGHSRYHLVGISMGGFISQLLSLQYPEAVRTLTLLCTTSGGDDFIPLPAITEESLQFFYSFDANVRARKAIKATVHPDLENENKKLFDWIVELRAENTANLQQLLIQKRAVDRFLSRSWPIESIAVPTLILTGEEDRFVSPLNSQRLQQKIKGAQLGTFPRTDHLFFFENSKDVSQHIVSFLKNSGELACKFQSPEQPSGFQSNSKTQTTFPNNREFPKT